MSAPDPIQDWQEFIQHARNVLLGDTKRQQRVDLLQSKLKPLAEQDMLEPNQLQDLTLLLIQTVPRYVDYSSRHAVVQVLVSLLSAHGTTISNPIVKWLDNETTKHLTKSTASNSRFVLLTWATAAWATTAKSLADAQLFSIGTSIAGLLDSILDQRSSTKPSLRQSALVMTRRAVRTQYTEIPRLVKALAQVKPASAGANMTSASLVGLAMDVALRLKGPKGREGTGLSYVQECKESILEYYVIHVVSAKTPPPAHVLSAFDDFFKATIMAESDIKASLLPALEKALLRSPETGLVLMRSFLSSLDPTVSIPSLRQQFLLAALNASKSTSPPVRSASVELLTALFAREGQDEVELAKNVLEQISALFKGGKTASPDHRQTLYAMLALLPTTTVAEVSQPAVLLVLGNLGKESHEATVVSMMRVVALHLPPVLQDSTSPALPSSATATLTKAMQEPKPGVRRAVHSAVAECLWSLPSDPPTEAARAFAEGVLPGLENALKTVAANATNAPAGSLEGYAAVAALKGRLSTWAIPKLDAAIASNPVMQSLYTPTGAKPAFLLYDKVYRKAIAASVDEARWVVRALDAVLVADEERFTKDQALCGTLANAIVYIAVEAPHFETRRLALELVSRGGKRSPKLTHKLVTAGTRSWLVAQEKAAASVKPATSAALVAGDDATAAPKDLSSRLRPVLSAFVASLNELDEHLRADFVSQLLVMAHHPKIARADAGVWVDLLIRANLAPEKVVNERTEQLLELLWQDAGPVVESNLMAQAAYNAATTLALVAPVVAVPRLFAQFQDDLAPAQLDFIGNFEFGVWATPAGSTFVDVLTPASKPKPLAGKKNSKEHETALWEQELRESLARKKPAAATLSKQDRLALEKQLELEAGVRARMTEALGRLRRGFALLLCLVNSRAELVREYLATMVSDVLRIITSRPATLVAEDAFETYQTLGHVCSDRLGVSRAALGVAVLRSVDAAPNVVPERFEAEPLPALVTRVLYRLRFLAEQEPFDAGTFAYAHPLVSKVLRAGGIGLDKSEAEATLEQVALALDVIAFHARQCSETAFPRHAMIGDLLAALIGYPTLSRAATTALADVGKAIKDNATRQEINALLDGALTEEASVRFACMQAIQPLDLTELEFPASLWIAVHDSDERSQQLAHNAWEENGLDVPEEQFLPVLIPFLAHGAGAIRQAAAEAIAGAIDLHPGRVAEAIEELVKEYKDKAKELLPQYDQFGMIIEESLLAEDPWRNRKAIATALRLMSVHFTTADVDTFFQLLIGEEALGDRSQSVRTEMLEAAAAVIDVHGKENLQNLMATFEGYLARPSTGDAAQDHVVESLIILLGRLARHLDPTDPRVKSVIDRLVEALRTPSEVVQSAVCDCMPPLVRVIRDDVPSLIDQLMNDMFNAEKYAERRGAAYGLAGVVRGRGISSLREFGIMGRLSDNAEDKKNTQARQGALFGYEILSTVLGRMFEPYVPQILPILLSCFGDASKDVREATQDAAKAIMGRLSAHAVKLIMPTLLEGLDEKQWRAKKGAIELMGAMAFLAPRQLSVSLPTILPRLTEVLTDTHKQVRESANASLTRFGEVVTNPEIKEMTPVLLGALTDPARKTPVALDTLLSTTFAHFIDSSSLALIIPILDRGLRERSADVKRKSSAIVGNMATLTETKDLTPYLGQLIPLLRGVLVDPVPEARATAAKSLGALVERLGENNFPDLIDSLMAVLKSQSSGVDQQGAAQGLAEVLQACGIDRLEGVLPTILANTSNPRTYVREGHISLLVFLPVTFGDRFAPYLGRIIQPVLNGLADDSDFVRDASMRAGRMIVANHSTKAVDLLLPELETGLFDESYRIRQSSVQLVGELLFRISGITGKPGQDDDVDGEDEAEEVELGTEAARKALIDTLGKERRDRVFSALYIVRQDAVGAVRQASLRVWKALVSNTPRTVRDILPVLMQVIVKILASPGLEQRETAARTLADTSRKLGETVLGEIIAILQRAMSSPERRQREGVCLALTEIMANATKSSLEAHEAAVIDVVRAALVDSDATVRTAAAQAFDVAQQVIGNRSIDETIPTLLDALQQPGDTADAALAALKEVMQVRAEKIFPVLIPRLIASPITAFNARALASLVRVAGPALGRRLTHIVDALQSALSLEKDESTLTSLDEALNAVLAAVEDHDSGLGSLLMHMLSLSKNEAPAKRVIGCELFTRFCKATEADFSDFTVDWVRQLVSLFDDRSPEVVAAAGQAMDALVKKLEKEEMEQLVVPLRRTIESVGTPGHAVDGFSRPNGLKPLLPILLQGLLAGTAEQREQAAYALGDLVERTEPTAFKTYTIQVVGPLIRVIGDRFPAPVKSAILSTLTILLTRVPQFVKPFFPQLQRTFVKSVTDPTSLSVRNRAAGALKVLMEHQARVDPVVTELCNLAATEQGEVRDSVVVGLANVVYSGGPNLGDAAKSSIVDLISEAFADNTNKESYNNAVAKLVASLARHDQGASLAFVIDSFVVGTDAGGGGDHLTPTSLSTTTIRELIDLAPRVLYEPRDRRDRVVGRVVRCASAGSGVSPSVTRPAREAKELIKERQPWCDDELVMSRVA